MKYNADLVGRFSILAFVVGILLSIRIAFDMLSSLMPLKVILSFLILVFLPGYLLFLVVYGRRDVDFLEFFPTTFVFGLSFLFVPLMTGYILNLGWDVLIASILVLEIMLILFTLLRGYVRRMRFIVPRQISRESYYTLILLTIFITILCLNFSTLIRGDEWYHLSVIRKLVEERNIVQHGANGEGITVAYGHNLLHILVALVSKFSGVNPVGVWIYGTVIVVPLIISAFYTLSKTLFNDGQIAVYSAFVFIVIYSLLYGDFEPLTPWLNSFFPAAMTRQIIVPIGLVFAFKYLRSGKLEFFTLSAVTGGLLSISSHLFDFVLFITALVCYGSFLRIFIRDFVSVKRIIKLIILTFVISSPYILLKLSYFEPVNERYLAMGYTKLIYISENLYLIDPISLQNFLVLIAFSLTPYLLLSIRRDDFACFLSSNMILPAIIMLTPFIVTPLSGIITIGNTMRFGWLFPSTLVISYITYILIQSKEFRSRFVGVITLFFILLAIIFGHYFFTKITDFSISVALIRGIYITLVEFFNSRQASYILIGSIGFNILLVLIVLFKKGFGSREVLRGVSILPVKLITTLSIILLFVVLPVDLYFFYYKSTAKQTIHLTDIENKIAPPEFSFLRNIPEKSNVLSDEVTSYKMGAHVKHHMVAWALDHSFEYESISQRNEDADYVLNGNANVTETKNILDKYDVDYIMVAPEKNSKGLAEKFQMIDGLEIFNSSRGYVTYRYGA